MGLRKNIIINIKENPLLDVINIKSNFRFNHFYIRNFLFSKEQCIFSTYFIQQDIKNIGNIYKKIFIDIKVFYTLKDNNSNVVLSIFLLRDKMGKINKTFNDKKLIFGLTSIYINNDNKFNIFKNFILYSEND